MKTNIRPNTKTAGFSMIEMIGVLAVIAILAALLIPKVFDAINSAKINNTASGLNTVKTAVVTYFGKYGALNVTPEGKAISDYTKLEAVRYDTNLLSARITDKFFETKIGTNATIELVAVTTGAPDGSGAKYWLSGAGGPTAQNDTAPASVLVQAHLQAVSIRDAMELSRAIDGPALSQTDATADDLSGRVQYKKPTDTAPGVTEVYVYMESK